MASAAHVISLAHSPLVNGPFFRVRNGGDGNSKCEGHPAGYAWPALLDVGNLTSTGTLATSTGVYISGNSVGSTNANQVAAQPFDFNGDGVDDLVFTSFTACTGGGSNVAYPVIYGQPMTSWTSGSYAAVRSS